MKAQPALTEKLHDETKKQATPRDIFAMAPVRTRNPILFSLESVTFIPIHRLPTVGLPADASRPAT